MASPSAVWRPRMVTSRRSAMASSRCDSCCGCTTADSSSVSSTGWSKRTPVAASLQLQEAHVEGRVVRHQHGVLRKGMEGRQHLLDGGLAGHHLGRDAVDRDAAAGIALRVDQLLEALLPAQLAVDDARGADLDDLVALGSGSGRWSRCRTRCRPARPAAVGQRGVALAGGEEVEVVVLGPAVAVHEAHASSHAAFGASGSRKRKKAWWRTRSRSNQKAPPWRSTTSRTVSGWSRPPTLMASVSQLITVSVLIAWPAQTRSSCARAPCGLQAQCTSLDAVLVDQPPGQVGQRLQQREAVDLEPQRVSTSSLPRGSRTAASMRRARPATRSAPSMSSSGQRVFRPAWCAGPG
jgi:hypothetical protein